MTVTNHFLCCDVTVVLVRAARADCFRYHTSSACPLYSSLEVASMLTTVDSETQTMVDDQ